MSKVLVFLGATVGGGIGWRLGARFGVITAFIVSMVGTGFGMFAGRWLARSALS